MLRVLFLWLLEPARAEAYLRQEEEFHRAQLAMWIFLHGPTVVKFTETLQAQLRFTETLQAQLNEARADRAAYLQNLRALVNHRE